MTICFPATFSTGKERRSHAWPCSAVHDELPCPTPTAGEDGFRDVQRNGHPLLATQAGSADQRRRRFPVCLTVSIVVGSLPQNSDYVRTLSILLRYLVGIIADAYVCSGIDQRLDSLGIVSSLSRSV